MRRPLAIACVLIVVLGAATLALRWQLASGTEVLMFALRDALAPQAALTWHQAAAGFDGRLGARDLVLTPAHGAPITIEVLELDLGGRWATLAALAPWSRHALPPRLRLALRGVRLAPEARAADAARTDAGAPLGLDALDVMPCGGLDRAGAWRELAAGPLVMDADIGWAYDGAANGLALDGALRARGFVDLALDLELIARDEVATLDGFARARPVARRGTLTLTERGWFEGSAALCAARSALDREAWLAVHADAATHLLEASGIEPSVALVAGYRAFRAAPERLRLTFDNVALRGADDLLAHDPLELAALVGLRIELNDAVVDGPAFALAGNPRLPAATPLADAPRDARGEPLAEPSVRSLLAPLIGSAPAPRPPVHAGAAPRAGSGSGSRTITLTPSRTGSVTAVGAPLAWDALGRQRGHLVVVQMHDGRELGGVLRDATPWRLTLEQRIAGGSAVLPLARADVARVYSGR